tara:strand:- start:34 stop:444 length:411 start_codon:yes stop_codon:yes gene_type:complete
MITPTGLYYRTKCIRTLKSIWNRQSTKNYVIDSIKRSSGNIKPVVVIDDTTKKAQCFFINADLTGFEPYTDMLLCRKIETIAEYSITKFHIQKSNKSSQEKEKYCVLNYLRNYIHKELEPKDEKAFDKFIKEIIPK